jgi:thermitase
VANLSYAATESSTVTSAARYALSKGMVVILAAGNCGCFDSTSANPHIISVSAIDPNAVN